MANRKPPTMADVAFNVVGPDAGIGDAGEGGGLRRVALHADLDPVDGLALGDAFFDGRHRLALRVDAGNRLPKPTYQGNIGYIILCILA